MCDRILLRKRSIIETMNGELKNICAVGHSGHRSVHNFIMSLIAAPGAYYFFYKKPAITEDFQPQTRATGIFLVSYITKYWLDTIFPDLLMPARKNCACLFLSLLTLDVFLRLSKTEVMKMLQEDEASFRELADKLREIKH
ncbi:MAG: transposase [Tannerella sp.]|jgi:hypothetical protein|nr:transposase [Tannerella sp.]